MSTRPPMRCARCNADGDRCEADATHQLLDYNGNGVPGSSYCPEHADKIVASAAAQSWNWTMEPLHKEATDE